MTYRGGIGTCRQKPQISALSEFGSDGKAGYPEHAAVALRVIGTDPAAAPAKEETQHT
jgi:hypothetical protein